MSRCETYSGDSWAGEDASDGGVAGRYGTLLVSAGDAGDYFTQHIEALRAAGEARPGISDVLESWRAKDPYGLLSSSSHMAPVGMLGSECSVLPVLPVFQYFLYANGQTRVAARVDVARSDLGHVAAPGSRGSDSDVAPGPCHMPVGS